MTASVTLEHNRLMVSGDLNFATVPELSTQSLPLLAQCSALQFDLSRVTSSNSAGLALLLEWLKYAKKTAKTISFAELPKTLMQIALAAGVDKMLTSS
jgi:phospholipid transport system transporter-binding protein